MSRRLDFNVENSWELVWSRTLNGARTPSNRLIGIQETIVPLLFDKFVVAVYCYSPYANSKQKGWRWGGYAVRRIRTGLTVGNAFDSEAGTKRPFWLNRVTLLMYEPIVPNYGLSFEYARWLPDINISVWQFLGGDYDSTEGLIRQTRADINSLYQLYERLIQ
ncbi:MAG: hypothetical protein HC763_02635 [Hydrococcus sp. CRU_1_1]|nr:hypothetical protein [Hydrococcus sp. CRU_1_1]